MKMLLEKLNYKGQKRIAVINATESFSCSLYRELKDVVVDDEIDPRFPYDFILLFVMSVSEVEYLAQIALHNLVSDGILWFCYPKKTSKKYSSDLERDRGWKIMNDLGFNVIRIVAIDADWSAMRFRNVRFIKSAKIRSAN
jgi:hypothetical protein